MALSLRHSAQGSSPRVRGTAVETEADVGQARLDGATALDEGLGLGLVRDRGQRVGRVEEPIATLERPLGLRAEAVEVDARRGAHEHVHAVGVGIIPARAGNSPYSGA